MSGEFITWVGFFSFDHKLISGYLCHVGSRRNGIALAVSFNDCLVGERALSDMYEVQ